MTSRATSYSTTPMAAFPFKHAQQLLCYSGSIFFFTYFPNEPPCSSMWFHCVVRCYMLLLSRSNPSTEGVQGITAAAVTAQQRAKSDASLARRTAGKVLATEGALPEPRERVAPCTREP